MHQRSRVDDLDDGAELDGAATLVAHQLGGQQEECGANALSAARAEMLANVGDRADVRDGVAPELSLDGGEVLA